MAADSDIVVAEVREVLGGMKLAHVQTADGRVFGVVPGTPATTFGAFAPRSRAAMRGDSKARSRASRGAVDL